MSTDTLRSELAALVAIDTERNELAAQLNALMGKRERQVGRMEVLAEQCDIDLEAFVQSELEARQG